MNAIRNGLFFILITAGLCAAQTPPWHQKTLIEPDIVNRFIDESSGEISMNHCIEMGAYNRNRYASEYHDTYLEAAYVLSQCKAYGFDTYEIEN